jgi:hypothetical protein
VQNGPPKVRDQEVGGSNPLAPTKHLFRNHGSTGLSAAFLLVCPKMVPPRTLVSGSARMLICSASTVQHRRIRGNLGALTYDKIIYMLGIGVLLLSRSMCPAKGPCRRRSIVHERLKNVSTKSSSPPHSGSREENSAVSGGTQSPAQRDAQIKKLLFDREEDMTRDACCGCGHTAAGGRPPLR